MKKRSVWAGSLAEIVESFGGLGYIMGSRYIGVDGRPVSRTPIDYPYSYDPYQIGKWSDPNAEGVTGAYCDRMRQWNYQKWQEAVAGSFKREGDMYREGIGKALLERFLAIYNGYPCEAVAVFKGANHANGYPYLYIMWKEKKEAGSEKENA